MRAVGSVCWVVLESRYLYGGNSWLFIWTAGTTLCISVTKIGDPCFPLLDYVAELHFPVSLAIRCVPETKF